MFQLLNEIFALLTYLIQKTEPRVAIDHRCCPLFMNVLFYLLASIIGHRLNITRDQISHTVHPPTLMVSTHIVLDFLCRRMDLVSIAVLAKTFHMCA